MELWDLYDSDRRPVGRTMERGSRYPDGCYHIVIHACLFGPDGRLLIQKRTEDKAGWPGKWDVSAAGSAVMGETSSEACRREIKEELGIEVDLCGKKANMSVNYGNHFDDFYIIQTDVSLSELTLQPEEVADAAWADRETVHKMIDDGSFIPYFHSLIDMIFDLRTNETAIIPDKKEN